MNSASVQNRIAPPTQSSGTSFSQATVQGKKKALDAGASADAKVDFRDLLGGSNSQAKAEREAKKSGDLSGAKSEDEFFRRLEDKTKQIRSPKNALDKDDFLKLFVTQLQYQDPTQPKDSSEMASQLAQFNGLEQMMNMNKGIEKLSKVQNSSRSLDLVGYIGKEVTIPKGKLHVEGNGKSSPATFTNKMDIADATLLVRDSSGVVLAEQPLGNFNPGEHKIAWDGKIKGGTQATPGIYSFEIVAKGGQGEQIPVEVATKVKVTGIDLQDEGGAFLTDVGKVKADEIRSVNIVQEGPSSNDMRKLAETAPQKGIEQAVNAANDTAKQQQPMPPIAIQEEALKAATQSVSAPQPEKKQQPDTQPPQPETAQQNSNPQAAPRVVNNDIFHPQVFSDVR